MTKPGVSVVMPVFNAGSYLAEAIESVLNQSYEDFEFIIVDDGSTDDSCKIAETAASLDPRIRLYTQTNSGLVASLNRGCSLACGAYIARMDGDDISLPQRLEKQAAYLDRHADVGVLGTWIQDIDAHGKNGPVWPLPTSQGTIPWFLMFGNCLAHPSVMMRRPIFQSLSYRPTAPHVEDYDLWIRASAMTRLANLPEVLLKYRVLSQSVSTRYRTIQEQQAAILQRNFRHEVLGTCGDVLQLYFAYKRRHELTAGDESEVVFDVFRRIYLSGELLKTWRRLVPLLPRLISLEALAKVLRYGRLYASSARHGFTSVRRAPE